MATKPTRDDRPDPEQQIKTLTFRECAWLILEFCDLPNDNRDVDACLRQLAKRRIMTTRRTSAYKETQVKDALAKLV